GLEAGALRRPEEMVGRGGASRRGPSKTAGAARSGCLMASADGVPPKRKTWFLFGWSLNRCATPRGAAHEKGGTLESHTQRESDRGDGRDGPGGPLADARPGRVPWLDRRTPERAAQDSAREGRLSSRAEEHARSPRRQGHAVRSGVGGHGRAADLRFLGRRGRRGEGRLRLRQGERQADRQG